MLNVFFDMRFYLKLFSYFLNNLNLTHIHVFRALGLSASRSRCVIIIDHVVMMPVRFTGLKIHTVLLSFQRLLALVKYTLNIIIKRFKYKKKNIRGS